LTNVDLGLKFKANIHKSIQNRLNYLWWVYNEIAVSPLRWTNRCA